MQIEPKLQELDKQVALLRQWVVKALALGEVLGTAETDDLTRLMDQRQRILDRTQKVMVRISTLQQELQDHADLSLAQKALVKEKRALISDLGPKILEQEKRILQQLRTKTQAINAELADNSRNTKLIRKYLT